MRRDTDPERRLEALELVDAEVALPNVDAGCVSERGEVGAIVHDEEHAVLRGRFDQSFCGEEQRRARSVLRAELQPTRPHLHCQLGKNDGVHCVACTSAEIDDGVELGRAQLAVFGHGVVEGITRWYSAVMSPLRRAAATLLGLGLLLLQSNARAVTPPPEEAALLEGLVLHVRESGPLRPWVIAIENATDARVNLVKDPRLLAFSVTVPGKKKAVSCRLPAAMLPAHAETERLRQLDPGQELRFRIDPRFYCFDGDEGVLVPGAMLEASYGFEGATRTTTRGGRKVTERLPSVPPYVAQFVPEALAEDDEAEAEAEEDTETASEPDGNEEAAPTKNAPPDASEATQEPEEEEHEPVAHDPDRPGLRSLRSVKLALGSEYASWDPSTRDEALTRGLVLEIRKGSDSLTARGAEVTVRITNRGHRAERLFVRRELISYYLLGPEGLSVCAADPELRAPDGQSFTTLGPGKQIQFVTRLVEFCPGELLDRPGFYLVGAELQASNESNEPGVDAFEGTLYTTRGKIVRIQKGELPFVHHNVPRSGLVFSHAGKMFRRGHGGGKEPAQGEAPANEGGDEDEPNDDEVDATE